MTVPQSQRASSSIDFWTRQRLIVSGFIAFNRLRRGMTFSDRKDLKRITEHSKATDYKLTSLSESLVTSLLFLKL